MIKSFENLHIPFFYTEKKDMQFFKDIYIYVCMLQNTTFSDTIYCMAY